MKIISSKVLGGRRTKMYIGVFILLSICTFLLTSNPYHKQFGLKLKAPLPQESESLNLPQLETNNISSFNDSNLILSGSEIDNLEKSSQISNQPSGDFQNNTTVHDNEPDDIRVTSIMFDAERLSIDNMVNLLQHNSLSKSLQSAINSKFLNEKIDSEWSEFNENRLVDNLAGVDGIIVDNLQCATTICKISIATTYDQEKRNLIEKIDNYINWESEQMIDLDASGNIIVFLAKEDSHLPRGN